MEKVDKKDVLILAYLRQNARETLTKMSRLTQIPVSTIFDKMKGIEQDMIARHTTLLDFNKIGFSIRANLLISVKKDRKQELSGYLMKHQNVNNLFKINNGFDFLVEVIFRDIKELEFFKEGLEERFSVKPAQTYFIMEDVKRESFMSDPNLIELLMKS